MCWLTVPADGTPVLSVCERTLWMYSLRTLCLEMIGKKSDSRLLGDRENHRSRGAPRAPIGKVAEGPRYGNGIIGKQSEGATILLTTDLGIFKHLLRPTQPTHNGGNTSSGYFVYVLWSRNLPSGYNSCVCDLIRKSALTFFKLPTGLSCKQVGTLCQDDCLESLDTRHSLETGRNTLSG